MSDPLNKKKNEDDGPKKDRGPDDKFEWRKAARTLAFWTLLILSVIIVSTYFSPDNKPVDVVSFTQYRVMLDKGDIESALVIDREFTGTKVGHGTGADDDATFKVFLPFVDQETVAEWEDLGLKIEFQERATNWVGYILTSILPWIVIIAFWLFLMRRMQGGGSSGLFNFGKSKAKLMIDNKPKVTFEDVAGGDEAKEELQEIIQFLKTPKKFQRLGGKIPKGALLVGPPGTGKTLMARAIAGEAEVPFFSMSGADFVEMFVGVGASRVRDLFEQGKKHAPCIIFIDEIDAVGRQRGAGLGGGHDEREQTLNQLLVEMDGFETNEGVILIAATNRPDVLDPALLRPGRFDRTIVVDRPDVRGREGILRVHSKNIPLDENVSLTTIAKGTPGFAGADLANLVNEAALLAARRDAERVTMRDFEDAKDKVMMGTERRSMVISEEEKKLTAYHEAGHALVAILIPGSDPVHKVTIIPRGRALGVTSYLPVDEKHSWAQSYIEDKLVHLMGGRAAERIIFDDVTNGAAMDISQASKIAKQMVCQWGMSDKIGPLAHGGSGEEIFLGRDFGTQKDYSEATALEIDREVKRIVMQAQQKAIELLTDSMDKLHLLANALLEREILDGAEILLVIDGKKLPPMGKSANGGNGSDSKEESKDDERLKKVDEALAKLDETDKDNESSGSNGDSDKSASNSKDETDKPAAKPAAKPATPRRKPSTPRRRPAAKSKSSVSNTKTDASAEKSSPVKKTVRRKKTDSSSTPPPAPESGDDE